MRGPNGIFPALVNPTSLASALNAGTTGGTSTAYTATLPGVSELSDGLLFEVAWHVAGGASPTLALNGLTAKSILNTYGTAARIDKKTNLVRYQASLDAFVIVALSSSPLTRFGTGRDGDVTLSGTNLSTSKAYKSVTMAAVSSNSNTQGWRLIARKVLSAASGFTGSLRTIGNAGNAASGATAGTATTPPSSTILVSPGNGPAGGAGGTTTGSVGGNASSGTTAVIGGVGGAGGTGGATGSAGGTGGTAAGASNNRFLDAVLEFGSFTPLITGSNVSYGACGGGGGGGAGAGGLAGGGGGAGGTPAPPMLIDCYEFQIDNFPSSGISATGGAGGAAAAASNANTAGGAGGGGGGGGVIIIVCWAITTSDPANLTTNLNSKIKSVGGAGGAGGAGNGTGNAGVGGTGGGSGPVYVWELSTGRVWYAAPVAGSAGSGTTGGAGGISVLSEVT